MNSLNSVLIEGNLPHDPEFNPEKKLCTFSVDSQRYYIENGDKKKETMRIGIEVPGKTAELCMKTLTKGRGVRVVGRLKESGEKLVIWSDMVEFKAKFDRKASDLDE